MFPPTSSPLARRRAACRRPLLKNLEGLARGCLLSLLLRVPHALGDRLAIDHALHPKPAPVTRTDLFYYHVRRRNVSLGLQNLLQSGLKVLDRPLLERLKLLAKLIFHKPLRDFDPSVEV